MSAPALPVDRPPALPAKPSRAAVGSPLDAIETIVLSVASLKLTVVLFALGIWVVLVGTLAQTEADIWQVVRDYFHAWVMWVDVNLLFPKSFFPNMPHLNFPLVPSPGGMTVGVLMALNLVAAHGWRFKIQAAGTRLWSGLTVLTLGILLTTLVILSGHNDQGFQAKPPFTYPQLWTGLQLLTGLGVLAGGGALFQFGIRPAQAQAELSWMRILVLSLLAGVLVLIGSVLLFSFRGAWYPGDEALRVLWQMVQGGLAAIVLLVGCVMVFRKRGGIVLLHAGIGLMMVNELLVARQAVEWQMFLQEGQTSNYLRDIRTVELAIIDTSAKETDEHTVIPRHLLERNYQENLRLAKNNKPPVSIQHELLPMQVAVLTYYKNADVRPLKTGEKPVATQQRGLKETLIEQPIAKGTDTGGAVDFAGAYVKLSSKDGKDLGTYLLSQLASEQKDLDRYAEKVTVDGKEYHLFLRFKRAYRPYTVTLQDVRKDDYVASDTPRNYSSDIRLIHAAAAVDQPVHIKMNDPMRYRGETYYQSGYTPARLNAGVEATTLQVVQNRIWMIPYVACMVVMVGLVAQFTGTAVRFIGRRENEELAGDSKKVLAARRTQRGLDWSLIGLPALVAGLFILWVGMSLRAPQPAAGEMDLARFGKLPAAHMGRIKPLDTLARNSLQAISNRDYVKLPDGTRMPAIQWLLETITGSDQSQQYRIFRIDHPELLKLFELEQRPGSFRYSVDEIRPQLDRFIRQAEAADKLRPEDLTVDQKKLLELQGRLKEYMMIVQSFSNPRLPAMPSEEEFARDPEGVRRRFQMAIFENSETMKQIRAPRVIPLAASSETPAEDHWLPYPSAYIMAILMGDKAEPAAPAFGGMLAAYAQGDPAAFNNQLARYEAQLIKTKPPLYSAGKVKFEEDFNRIAPFKIGMYAYFFAFVLAILGWLVRWPPLNWTAFTLIVLTLIVHTAALAARIYISGRPPVTNLYSSAVFIGWAAVLFGVAIEAIYRVGLGNIIAAVAGYATLLIAGYLAMGGDTIAVLQAVLDTQFWLATHVVCVTLGYAATYAAGLLGMLYILAAISTPLLDEGVRKTFARMIYGIICFALLFSFVGTVLGGLWADDSWGRFWGWDPKENGALIIVLWNALVLHARWDKMIADRGLAVLSIVGNIVTSWSWFGVNELGIGLHSYGFTSGVVFILGVHVVLFLSFIVAGIFPRRWWWSSKPETPNVQALGIALAVCLWISITGYLVAVGWAASKVT